MSVERHPNVNAVGLTVEVIEGFKKYLRGNAAKEPMKALGLIEDDIQNFIIRVSESLDQYFGVKNEETNK
jgi:hypothetical protein